MSWLYLMIAGMFEVAWAVGIKYCQGTQLSFALISVTAALILSVVFLSLATRTLPMSLAYAILTGIGIVGVFLYGIFILKEPAPVLNIVFVAMILIGIIGLKLSMKQS